MITGVKEVLTTPKRVFAELCKKLERSFKPIFTDITYGRSLELASGLGLLLVAFSMYFGMNANTTVELVFSDVVIIIAVMTGIGQLICHKLTNRICFNLLSSAFWCTISYISFIDNGGMNLLTAASIPYTLSTMFVFGALLGQKK